MVVLLLLAYLILGLSASRTKSQTGDEGLHLTGGVSYWITHDYRIQPENGNWPQRWCGLPVWLSGYRLPSIDAPSWRALTPISQWVTTREFIYECGNDVDTMLLLGRAMTAILGAILGLLVFSWSKQLFGDFGGLLSLSLFVFSPMMLTHGFLITSDMASGLFFLASVYAMWRMLHRISLVTLCLTWFTLSGLFLSKFSAVIIIPIGLLILGMRLTNPQSLQVCFRGTREIRGWFPRLAIFVGIIPIMALGVGLSIWTSYGFRFSMLHPTLGLPTDPIPWNTVESSSHVLSQGIAIAREHRLLPEAYLFGFSHVLHYSESRAAFLNGELRQFGWTSFFPYCLAYKTPLELFLLLILAGRAAGYFRSHKRQFGLEESDRLGSLYDVSPLLVLYIVYWGFALTSHLNLGHRHLLPTYPTMFILAGAAGWWFRSRTMDTTANSSLESKNQRSKASKIVIAARGFLLIAVSLHACEALWIWPNYLAYFNLIAGGPSQGHKHLIDSSLDWSQDLKGVRAWLDKNRDLPRNQGKIYFSFFGDIPLEYYGVAVERLPSFPYRLQPRVPEPLVAGTYLMSATMLRRTYANFVGRWNKKYEEMYQTVRTNVGVFEQLRNAENGNSQLLSVASELEWAEIFRMYEDLRFGRLASFCSLREPDEQIGYSILVYRLTQADVEVAINGPPVELLEMPELKIEAIRMGKEKPINP